MYIVYIIGVLGTQTHMLYSCLCVVWSYMYMYKYMYISLNIVFDVMCINAFRLKGALFWTTTSLSVLSLKMVA